MSVKQKEYVMKTMIFIITLLISSTASAKSSYNNPYTFKLTTQHAMFKHGEKLDSKKPCAAGYDMVIETKPNGTITHSCDFANEGIMFIITTQKDKTIIETNTIYKAKSFHGFRAPHPQGGTGVAQRPEDILPTLKEQFPKAIHVSTPADDRLGFIEKSMLMVLFISENTEYSIARLVVSDCKHEANLKSCELFGYKK
jgi:hypothetical protein